jgi:hypothetical protein
VFCQRRQRWRGKRLWFVDESGVNLALTRANGWAPRGERLVDHVPGRRWENFSLIAALSLDGVHAPLLLPGAMNTEAMRVWARDFLAPLLKPGDIVIWENLGIHTDFEVRLAVEGTGARLEFLPPYSPDLNRLGRMSYRPSVIARDTSMPFGETGPWSDFRPSFTQTST